MGIFFSNVVFFLFSGSGYGNALSFKNLKDEDIHYIEQKVKQNGISIEKELNNSADMNCEVSNEHMIEIFGKKYADIPSKFCFERGEILLIKELVAHVKHIVDSNGENSGLFRFKYKQKAEKKSKKSQHRKLCSESSNNHDIQDVEPSINSNIDENRLTLLRLDLFKKACDYLKQCAADQCINIEMLDMSIIDIKQNDGQIFGTIICAICQGQNAKSQKPKSVYYNETPTRSNWVLSNFQKHLKCKHGLNPTQHIKKCITRSRKIPKNNGVNLLSEGLENDYNAIHQSEYVIEEEIEVISQPLNEAISLNNNWLYTQLGNQITNMITASLSNGDDQDQMYFLIDEQNIHLTVAKIAADHNCMFGALAHQLYQHPTSSTAHRNATKTLRAEVVEYILEPENFPSFKYALQNRIYETKKKNEIENMENECKFFVRYVLSRENQEASWGCFETIKAVSDKYRVNIITFNENGTCILQHNINENFEKTIAIAYRMGVNERGEEIRNHYDSVCEISSDDMYTVADFLIKHMK